MLLLDDLANSVTLINSQIQNSLLQVGLIILTLWIAFLLTCFNKNLLILGIIPRKIYGLPGILFAPFLHANFNHLFFNTIPLAVLSSFILTNGLLYYILVTALITILSGFAIWCFAKNGIHIGASALITGYWGFLVSSIYQHTTTTTLILGGLSLYYFAGIFLGIFPRERGVSWEGHLFGLLAGVATSYLLSNQAIIQFFSAVI